MGKLSSVFSTCWVRDAGREKKAWRIITFSTFICGISSSTDFMILYLRLVSLMSHLSQELEENKRLPGIQFSSRSHKNTYDASLSAAIQMSCVARAATSRAADTPTAARHLKPPLWQPGLTPTAPPLHLPHLPPLPRTIRETSAQPRHPRHHHPPALKAPSASAWRRASLSAAQLHRPRMNHWERRTNPATARVSSDCCCT